MATEADITEALTNRLPAELHEHAANLARVLTDVVGGTLSTNAARARLADPVLKPVLQILTGQIVAAGGTQIQFVGSPTISGNVGTLQQITITGSGSVGAIIGQITITLHDPLWKVIFREPLLSNLLKAALI